MPISWLAPSQHLQDLFKIVNRITRANIVTSGPRNFSKVWGQNISIAYLAPITWLAALATCARIVENFPIAFLAPIFWLALLATSPRTVQNFQSHFSRQYRDYRHSQHLQSLVDFEKFSIAFLTPISWLALLTTSPKFGRLKTKFNRISRANIVTSGTSNISKAWTTSKNFQSHFSRQYRD